MLSSKVIERINEVDSKEEYEELMDSFKTSTSDLRFEAMMELSRVKSEYNVDRIALLEDIRLGQGDTNDIGGTFK